MMMEARPSAPLVVPEPNFLFEILLIALDAPAHFGEVDQTSRNEMFLSSVESQYLVGSALALRPLDQQRLFRLSF